MSLRHYLHAHPELSGEETGTSEYIRNFFERLNPDRITRVAKNGLLIKFGGKQGVKKLLLRAELDALPIQEINSFEHKSVVKNTAHKCGHDGHMAILCGIGEWISRNRPEKTDVYLLFQPSEENGKGASAVVEDPSFDIRPDFCFAMHNIPGQEKHQIIIKEGTFTPSVISLIIELEGKTSHAAEPEKGINPAMAIAELVRAFEKFNNNKPEKEDFFVSTPIFIEMGSEAYGTSAGSARLGFTFRCWDNQIMQDKKGMALEIADEISRKRQLKPGHHWVEEFYANINDRESTKILRKAVDKEGLKSKELSHPFKWGEDFGYFTSRFPGAMTGLGSGLDCPALHNPDYDFPDVILETGIKLYQGIIKTIDENAG